MAQVNDTIASSGQHPDALSLHGGVMLGDAITRRSIEFDVDPPASDVIQDDQVHGFLSTGLDSGMDGEARPAHPQAALLGVTLDLLQKVFLGLSDDRLRLDERQTERALGGIAEIEIPA